MAIQLTAADSAQHILEANQRGMEIVSVLATTGAAAGSRLLVLRDDTVTGSLGSAPLDDAARDLAGAVFASREPTLVDGLFAELHAPAEQLLIFGAGHIAVPLADLGVRLGFSVIVLDDRDEFASADRFPSEARIRRLELERPLDGLLVDHNTYVVLVTRAHKHDFELLRAMLQLVPQPRYIGLIGSRRRIRAAFTALLEGGVAREQLTAVHAPVGLDIGAETPAEIAVSIAAEIIRVRRGGGTAASIGSEERVLDRFFAEGTT